MYVYTIVPKSMARRYLSLTVIKCSLKGDVSDKRYYDVF